MTTQAPAPKSARKNTGTPYQEVFPTHWDCVQDPATGKWIGSRLMTVTTTLTLDEFRQRFPQMFDYAEKLVKRFGKRRLIFVNSTGKGGGVVIMRKPLIAVLQLMGANVDWYVLAPDEKAFRFTKWTVHNGLQGLAEAVPFTDEGAVAYLTWIAREAEVLKPALAEADVVVIDDWQPSRLIWFIKRWGFDCKIILRDHIQTMGELMVTEGTLQYPIWKFLWEGNRICDADLVVTHPRDIFVPPNVPSKMVSFAGATVELNDELLREVTDEEIEREFAWLQHQFQKWGHAPLDRNRRYIVLMARFDESKFMDGALKYYRRLRKRLLDAGVKPENLPQLVLIGNGATDDPSGRRVLAKIRRLVRRNYRDIMSDIHVGRVPHRDLAINVIIRHAWMCIQPSIREGFESRVTDAIELGVPVIGSTEGGIPLQIREGLSGYVLDPYDYDAWAKILAELFLDEERYQELRRTTAEVAESHNSRFTTIYNVIGWLTLAIMLVENPDYDYNRQWADNIPLPGLDHPPVPDIPGTVPAAA